MINGIIHDSEGDILLQNGDFVTGDTTPDIVADTIDLLPGDNKNYPLFGCGLRLAIGGKPDVFFPGKLKLQTKAQGITVKKVSINKDDISVEL
jgi:hypothetical protein